PLIPLIIHRTPYTTLYPSRRSSDLRRTDADAYSLSLDQVADRAEEAWADGATEVCMQGGIDPELPGTAYFDLAAAVKQRVPDMQDRKSTRLNSSHVKISYAVFCLKK